MQDDYLKDTASGALTVAELDKALQHGLVKLNAKVNTKGFGFWNYILIGLQVLAFTVFVITTLFSLGFTSQRSTIQNANVAEIEAVADGLEYDLQELSNDVFEADQQLAELLEL